MKSILFFMTVLTVGVIRFIYQEEWIDRAMWFLTDIIIIWFIYLLI